MDTSDLGRAPGGGSDVRAEVAGRGGPPAGDRSAGVDVGELGEGDAGRVGKRDLDVGVLLRGTAAADRRGESSGAAGIDGQRRVDDPERGVAPVEVDGERAAPADGRGPGGRVHRAGPAGVADALAQEEGVGGGDQVAVAVAVLVGPRHGRLAADGYEGSRGVLLLHRDVAVGRNVGGGGAVGATGRPVVDDPRCERRVVGLAADRPLEHRVRDRSQRRVRVRGGAGIRCAGDGGHRHGGDCGAEQAATGGRSAGPAAGWRGAHGRFSSGR